MMITTCIGTNNTLPYLKLAVTSVRKNHHFSDSPLIVCAENCTDGTNEWLEENKEKYNITPVIIKTDSDDEIGIGGGMNLMADAVQTEFINFIHADMYVAPNQDLELLNVFAKYPNEKLVVSSHRVQPRVFKGDTGRPGTVIVDNDVFGDLHNTFDQDFFDEWSTQFSTANNFEIPKGEGVSFLIRKTDWDEIGGNDPLFNPLSFDDMDLFLRMRLAEYKFVLTSKSVVYHFGSRSFNGHFAGDNLNQRSSRQAFYEQRSAQRFVEKWGGMPTHDHYGMVSGISK
jgi:GT2 family glycosyltransferase